MSKPQAPIDRAFQAGTPVTDLGRRTAVLTFWYWDGDGRQPKASGFALSVAIGRRWQHVRSDAL